MQGFLQGRGQAALSGRGAGLGRWGLGLLVDGRRLVGGAHLALAFFVLLLFARDFALALFERVVGLGQENLLKWDGGRSLPRGGLIRVPEGFQMKRAERTVPGAPRFGEASTYATSAHRRRSESL